MSLTSKAFPKPPDPPDPYLGCCLYVKDVCRPSSFGKYKFDKLVSLDTLEKNSVDDYFTDNLHKKDSLLMSKWNEKTLIENRAGRSFSPSSVICPYHRFSLGVKWKPSKQCIHPCHQKVSHGRKAYKTLVIPLATLSKLNSENPFLYKIGSKMCKNHLYSLNFSDNCDDLDDEPFESHIDNCDDLDDEPFEPHIASFEDVPDQNVGFMQNLCSQLNISPVKHRFGVTKPLEELSNTHLAHLKRKRQEFLSAAMTYFDSVVTPGQSCSNTGNLLDQDHDNCTSNELLSLVDAYKESDSFGKIAILSTVNHDLHSKEEIMNAFGCTKYSVDKARSIKSNKSGVRKPENVVFKRTRLNTDKVEHFISFLFSSGLMQDVAYGSTIIRFDSGESQSVPHAILQSKYSHLISFYNDSCSDISYTPLSESSLWRIIRSIKPSQRKSLAGLDDITADGMNGFETINTFLSDLKVRKTLLDDLEKTKRYLKMNYQGHCNTSSPIATHNTAFALSTPKEEPCLNVVDEVCDGCFTLFQVLQEAKNMAESTGNEDFIYDIDNAVNRIIDYMKHQIRDEQQKQAKIFCFQEVSETTAFWLRDYAQKILPKSYREGQRNYFGKKGMSMHIDIFYIKESDQIIKQVYTTLVYRCEQTKVETMNIASVVLDQFKLDFPSVSHINGKSDNASCYHGNYVLENLYFLCKSKGLVLKRYDYNEPCRGKDQCDRESSGAKSLINSFVDSGNDLLTATDVYDALHYGRGMSNTKAAVIEIDSSKSILVGQDIAGINSYHSAVFFNDNMKLFRYYGVGIGKEIRYQSSEFLQAFIVKREFHETSNTSHSKNRKSSINSSRKLFFCVKPSCSAHFDTETELEKHLLSESHIEMKLRSSMDHAKSSFIKKMKVSSASRQIVSTRVITSSSTLSAAVSSIPLFSEVAMQGWAIPRVKKFRYSVEQKAFLYNIFIQGQKTGKKSSPEEVELLVRQHFSSTKDYVTAKQIRSLFSTFARQAKENTLTDPSSISKVQGKKNCVSGDEEVDKDIVKDVDAGANMEEELAQITEDVISRISTWEEGMWVVVRIRRRWLPGRIVSLDNIGAEQVEDGCFAVDLMEGIQNSNKFKWPNCRDVRIFDREDILLDISDVSPIGTDAMTYGDIVWCQLNISDYNDANEVLRKLLLEDIK